MQIEKSEIIENGVQIERPDTAIKTVEEWVEFLSICNGWMDKNKVNESKLKYAIVSKFVPQFKKMNQNVNEEIQDINIKYCSVDENQNIMKDVKGEFMYKKDTLKLRNKEVKALNQKKYTINTYFVQAPEGLTETEKEVFTNIFI